jgi:hypothetical protein
VSINVKGARIDDPFAIKIAGLEDHALIPSAEDCSLARAVDEYQRLGAGTPRNYGEVRLDTCAGKLFVVQRRGGVVAQFAYVSSAHSPVLTGNYGGCDLAPGQYARRRVFDLGSAYGVVRERDHCVYGVEADADKVNLRQFRHIVTVNGIVHGAYFGVFFWSWLFVVFCRGFWEKRMFARGVFVVKLWWNVW